MLDVYKIDAHRDKVEDLPVAFMEALQCAMHDKSYGNDACASFGMIHPDKDKMYHLWIDTPNKEEREIPNSTRFYFNIIELDEPFVEGDRGYLGCCGFCEVRVILETDSVDDLSVVLAQVFPAFKAVIEQGHSLDYP